MSMSIKARDDKRKDRKFSLTNRLGGEMPLRKWLTIAEVLSEYLLIMPARLPFR